jgi:hypothetical protein
MTPASVGLTVANRFEFTNLARVSVAHHSARLAVLLVVFVGALGLSQPSVAPEAKLAQVVTAA